MHALDTEPQKGGTTPWSASIPGAFGSTTPSAVPIQPIPPAAAPDTQGEPARAREEVASVSEPFMNGLVPPELAEIGSDARMQDASANPGMNLLLSLSLRLVPNGKNGELSNTFDFGQAPAILPTDPSPAQEPSLLPNGLATAVQPTMPPSGASAVPMMPTPADPTPVSTVPKTLEGPKMNGVLEGMQGTGTANNPILPPFPSVPGPPSDAACLSGLPPFDRTAQLDSLASAASETAASEYAGMPLYGQNPDGSVPASSLSSYLSSQSPATYLSMMRNAPLSMPQVDSARSDGAQVQGPEIPRTTSPTQLPDARVLGQGATRPPSATPPAIPLSRNSSSDSKASMLTMSTPDPDLQRPAAAPVESNLTASGLLKPQNLSAASQPGDDEEAQRRAIEEAVRNLSTHHRLAQTAAVQHHQRRLGLPLKPSSESEKKHALEPLNGEAKRARSSTPTSSELKSHALGKTAPDAPASTEMQRSVSATDPNTQKRFQCPKCSRAFARAYNLNTHLSTHDPDPTRAKPFSCPYRSCKSEGGRSFSRKHDLQRHVASVHEWEPEPGLNESTGEVVEGGETGGLASLGLGAPGKKFRCEKCSRAFVRRDALRRHHCGHNTSSAPHTPTSQRPPYPVRSFSGEMVHQVAYQLMADADETGAGDAGSANASEVRSGSAISVVR